MSLILGAAVCAAFGFAAPASAQQQGVLTLAEAENLLVENHDDVAMAQARVSRVQTIDDQVRAAMLPTFNLTGTYTFRDQEVLLEFPNALAPLSPYLESVYDNDPDLQQFLADNPDVPDARALAAAPGQGGVIQYQHDYRVSATLTQTLWNQRIWPGLEQAEIRLEQAQIGYEQVLFALRGALIQLYFNAVRFQQFIAVSERNLDVARIAHQRTEAALDEDVGTQFEVNRASVALFRAERELENANLAYQLAIDSLATFLDVERAFDVSVPAELTRPTDLQPLLDNAFANRPERQMQQLEVERMEARVREMRATWAPFIFAQAQATYQRASAFSGNDISWNLSATLSWDIWDGGFRLADTEARQYELLEQEIALGALEDEMVAELRQSLLRLEAQERIVASARAELDLATLNFDLSEEARGLGVATAVDVELAQQQLFLAELAVVNAETQLQAEIYELYRLAFAPR